MNAESLKNDASKWSLYGYLILLIHNLLMSFSTMQVPTYVQLAMLASAGLCIVRYIWVKRYLPAGDVVLIFMLLALAGAGYLQSGKMDMLYYVVMLYILQDVDLDRFLQADVIARLMFACVSFLLSQTGIIRNSIYLVNGRIKYGCGFNNPNSFGYMLFLIVAEILILTVHNKGQLLYKMISLCSALLLVVYFASGTKTAVIMGIALILCAIVVQNKRIVLRRWLSLSVLIPSFITWILQYGYSRQISVFRTINRLMTGRLALFSSFVRRYSPTVFGQSVRYITSTQAKKYHIHAVICDNVYLYLLCNIGICAAMIWITTMLIATYRICKNNDVISFFVIMILLVYGIAENTMSNPMMFPVIIYCSHSVFGKEKYETSGNSYKPLPLIIPDTL